MSIHLAAKEGDTLKIEQILSEDNDKKILKLADEFGRLPLHVAVQNGQQGVAELLLKRGADEYAQTSNAFRTPLHIAAARNNMFFIDLLDKNKTKLAVKARDIHGYTPLHVAVGARDEQSVATLLERGADIEAKNKHGRTSLHYAVQKKNHSMVKFLLNKGADIRTRDRKASSVLHSAEDSRMYILLNSKYHDFWHEDELQDNCDGQTPLHLAAKRGDRDIVEDMCKRGAIPAEKDNNGQTPLDFAREGEFKETLRCLVYNADLQLRDPKNYYSKRKRS